MKGHKGKRQTRGNNNALLILGRRVKGGEELKDILLKKSWGLKRKGSSL